MYLNLLHWGISTHALLIRPKRATQTSSIIGFKCLMYELDTAVKHINQSLPTSWRIDNALLKKGESKSWRSEIIKVSIQLLQPVLSIYIAPCVVKMTYAMFKIQQNNYYWSSIALDLRSGQQRSIVANMY